MVYKTRLVTKNTKNNTNGSNNKLRQMPQTNKKRKPPPTRTRTRRIPRTIRPTLRPTTQPTKQTRTARTTTLQQMHKTIQKTHQNIQHHNQTLPNQLMRNHPQPRAKNNPTKNAKPVFRKVYILVPPTTYTCKKNKDYTQHADSAVNEYIHFTRSNSNIIFTPTNSGVS